MKRSLNSSKLGIVSFLAAVFLAVSASAQDSVPTPKKTIAPHLKGTLAEVTGEVHVYVDINEYGFVTHAEIKDSTNPDLNNASLAAIHQWTFTPATKDGSPVSAKAIQPFYFNRGSIVLDEKKTPDDKHPVAKNTVQPTLSDDLKNITGEVVLQAALTANVTVDSVSVKSSTHSELEAAAAEALARWSFSPAVKEGEKVASSIIVPFHFHGSGNKLTVVATPTKALDAAPVALRQPTPELPKELRNSRGEAKLQLTVDAHGYVADVEIIESSNEELSTAAQEAVLQWKFKPAIKDGTPVASTVVQPFSFNGGLLTADLPVDSMPKVRTSRSPELPEALTKVQGFVKVRLNLDARGNVTSASCAKSSHDELVSPTLEAAKAWTFRPAIRDGEKVPSSVIVPFVFNERS